MSSNLPLHIQSFGNLNDQTLVILQIASLRSHGKSATPKEVDQTFIDLRVPPPANVSQHLSALAKQKLVLPPVPGRWAPSQLGTEKIRQLMLGATDENLASLIAKDSPASLGDAHPVLLPPTMAPRQFRDGIGRFLEGHPFDQNVFGITRFPREKLVDDPIAHTLAVCREACAGLGLQYHVASDRSVEELLFSNVVAAMWACKFGIAIVEDTVGEGVKHNVTLEVGAMLMTGRPCLLLKDVSVPKMATDLIAHIYVEVDIRTPDTVGEAIRTWARDRLGLP